MINLDYLEQLIDSIERGFYNIDKVSSEEEKDKIKSFIYSICREIDKLLSGEKNG